MRRSVAWLLSLPLTALGALLGHTAAYRLVEPTGHERTELLAGTGHAYLAWWPFVVTAAITVVIAGVWYCAFEAARCGRVRSGRSWPFAALPVAVFAVQEHVERLSHTGTFPLELALEPVFLVGLLLQVPFALAALAVGRALVTVACAVAAALASAIRRPRGAPPVAALPAAVAVPRLRPLAAGAAGRGPPLA